MSKRRPVSKEELDGIKDHFFMRGGLLYKRLPDGKFRQTGMYKDKAGRHTVNYYNKIWYLHRLAYFLYHDVWPGDLSVDHIDGDMSNNKKSNLRLLTPQQNQMAYNKSSDAFSSPWRGVYFCNEKKKNAAQITHNRKRKFLGYFTCGREAAMAYNIKAQELGFFPEAFNVVFEDVPEELLLKELSNECS